MDTLKPIVDDVSRYLNYNVPTGDLDTVVTKYLYASLIEGDYFDTGLLSADTPHTFIPALDRYQHLQNKPDITDDEADELHGIVSQSVRNLLPLIMPHVVEQIEWQERRR